MYGCGHRSLAGSWLPCNESAVERRRAPNGQLYTFKEFAEYYASEGERRWLEAAPHVERRLARDGSAYGVREFRDFCVDSFGEDGWLRQWAGAAPQRRRAPDGGSYAWEEFREYYGLQRAWKEWESASEEALPRSTAPPATTAAQVAPRTAAKAPTVPRSSEAVLVRFDLAKHPEARCLDGTSAGYYLREGTENKYMIYFEGGSWCYDSNCRQPSKAGTLRDCRARARGRLGSSAPWPRVKPASYLGGWLSKDPGANPVFHNWTLVYVPYCDGASFSGDAVVDGLHFKGKAILVAVVDELRSRTGIRQASQVALAGGSAGASAVYIHADRLAEALQLEGGEVVALPDAGFFLDLPDRAGHACWPSQMRSLFDVANGYSSLHPGCLRRFPEEQWKCILPEYFADLIATRTFVINSLYDSSEITYTLGLQCCPGACGGRQPQCGSRDRQLFEGLRAAHTKSWAALVEKPGNGLWAPSCVGHTLACDKWTDSSWAVPEGSANTLAAAVQRWLLRDAQGGRGHVYADSTAWPGNGRCAGEW